MRRYTRTNSTHMTIVSTACNNHILAQTEFLGPLFAEVSHGFIGRFGICKEPFAEAFEFWLDTNEEVFRWKSVPIGVPHGFVSASATAAYNLLYVGNACEYSR